MKYEPCVIAHSLVHKYIILIHLSVPYSFSSSFLFLPATASILKSYIHTHSHCLVIMIDGSSAEGGGAIIYGRFFTLCLYSSYTLYFPSCICRAISRNFSLTLSISLSFSLSLNYDDDGPSCFCVNRWGSTPPCLSCSIFYSILSP